MATMDSDDNNSSSSLHGGSVGANPPDRFGHLRRVLERVGPFSPEGYEATPDILKFIHSCKVLVVGAGGLGCELVKNLALMGFQNMHIIDMDTIDLSNLNRQFLFRIGDVGQSKAEVAAAFINKRVQSANVTAYYSRIEDHDEDFYSSFHIIVCGLDSIVARRWLNNMVFSLLRYDDDGAVEPDSVIPIVDGGTEGFKGNARVICPGQTPCIECNLDLFPPQINYPLCTLASKPRLPEHCIEYVRLIQWGEEKPFEVPIDGDDPAHINWIYEKAVERASLYGIQGVTYRLTQGVVKHIIPAVASTNAVIAAACATEVLKIASSCCTPMDNFMNFSDSDGIYTYTYKAERREDCMACSNVPKVLEFAGEVRLGEVIEFLQESPTFQMKHPAVIASVGGRSKTLYMAMMSATHSNLEQKMKDLGIADRGEIVVSDATTPAARTFILQYKEAGAGVINNGTAETKISNNNSS